MHSNSVDQCIQFREKKIDMHEQIKEWLSGTDQVMDRTGNARTAKKKKNLNGTLVINFLNQHIALAIGKICSLDRLEPEQLAV